MKQIYNKFKYIGIKDRLIIIFLLLLTIFSIFCCYKIGQDDISLGILLFILCDISSLIYVYDYINSEYNYIKRKEEREELWESVYKRNINQY